MISLRLRSVISNFEDDAHNIDDSENLSIECMP